MASDQRYVMADTGAEAESARLGLLEQCRDPGTIGRLEALDIERGWRCLEVGVLAKFRNALRPGGVFLAEESDYGLINIGGHDDAGWLNDLTRRTLDGATAAGATNAYVGRTLPALALDAGLELTGGEVETRVARPGDPYFEFQRPHRRRPR